MIITIKEFKLILENNAPLTASEIQDKLHKMQSVNVIDENEYNDLKNCIITYRGFSNENDIISFIKEPKMAKTPFGTGIYTTPDINFAKSYGNVLEMKINKNKLISQKDLNSLINTQLQNHFGNDALKLYNDIYIDIGLAALGFGYDAVIKEDNVILIINPAAIFINSVSINN